VKAVHTAGTEVEAVMVQGILEGAGIPVVLRPRESLAYGDVVELTAGWGELLVPDAHEMAARELVAEYLASVKDEARQ